MDATPINGYQQDRTEVAEELRKIADLVEAGEASVLYVYQGESRQTYQRQTQSCVYAQLPS